ncbi:MAG: hypothetical protein K0Q79_1202 [Flavipsychrobacter sp.]|jgi:sugar lactone lactonase YvrE|nr:hypothetical protein [Flavipsychrobacter sp.]
MKRLLHFLAVIVFLANMPVSAQAQLKILTIVGKGDEGYTGDGTMADTCMIHWPEDITFNDSNDMFIADANNNVIRRVDKKTGIIRTIAGSGFRAGTGLGGFSGDGGPATAARMWYPSGVEVDAIGNVYIADQRNHRIRKVDTFGIITTYAGDGFPGYFGNFGPATAAKLYYPTRLTMDASGNLFFADSGNQRIRKIDAAGIITPVAGNGVKGSLGDGAAAATAELHHPIDIEVDGAGNLYIADYSNNRIRKIDAGGIISTYAGIGIPGFSGDGGPATAANIYEPSSLAIDGSGNLYFSDLANSRVRKIDAAGIITTIAGNGSPGYNGDNMNATAAKLWFPEGIAIDSRGQLFVCDKGNNRIRLISGVLNVNELTEMDVSVSLYPNPNNGTFTVNIVSPVNEEVHVAIINITGQKVNEMVVNTNTPVQVTIGNNTSVPPGMYLLSASTPHGVLNERVMVR